MNCDNWEGWEGRQGKREEAKPTRRTSCSNFTRVSRFKTSAACSASTSLLTLPSSPSSPSIFPFCFSFFTRTCALPLVARLESVPRVACDRLRDRGLLPFPSTVGALPLRGSAGEEERDDDVTDEDPLFVRNFLVALALG